MNRNFLLLCNLLFGPFAALVASSKSSSSDSDTHDIIAKVHFDTEALISTQVAVIEEALKLGIFDEDVSEQETRNHWRILQHVEEIKSRGTFHRTMFKIGYVLNEAPAGLRFALLGTNFLKIPHRKQKITILRAPLTSKLYGILDVVKSLYESGGLIQDKSIFAGIILSRPTQLPEYELQFVVHECSEHDKIDLSGLLRYFGLPEHIKERNEEIAYLQDVLYEPEKPSLKIFVGEETDPSPSDASGPTSAKVTRRRRARSFNRKADKSPEPGTQYSLLPSIEEISSPKEQPLFARKAPLKLPQITKSFSVDSSLSSLSDNTPAKPKKRYSWSDKGHSNPHLGRRATYALIPQAYKSSSSSTDLSCA